MLNFLQTVHPSVVYHIVLNFRGSKFSQKAVLNNLLSNPCALYIGNVLWAWHRSFTLTAVSKAMPTSKVSLWKTFLTDLALSPGMFSINANEKLKSHENFALYGECASHDQLWYENWCKYIYIRVKEFIPCTSTVSEDSPLKFSTVQLYVPTMSLWPTDGSMVSTVW